MTYNIDVGGESLASGGHTDGRRRTPSRSFRHDCGRTRTHGSEIRAPYPPITFFPPQEKPTLVVAPDEATQSEEFVLTVSEPDPSLIPHINEAPAVTVTYDDPRVSETGRGVVHSAVEYQPPTVRTRDSRLAAAIDACYPAASRRAGEEGRVVARIMIDAGGQASAWGVAATSGFSRLDAALDCVIRRIEFVAGRREGRGVAAEAMLPIVFRLN